MAENRGDRPPLTAEEAPAKKPAISSSPAAERVRAIYFARALLPKKVHKGEDGLSAKLSG
jgi:hypothetical protein